MIPKSILLFWIKVVYYQTMTNADFKQILDEALKPIKEDQAEFREKLDEVSSGQESLKQELAEVKNTIETRVLPPLIYIETTIKGYSDMYKINDSNIRRMEKRLETLEEDAGVDVPPELKLEPLFELPPQP